MLFLKYVRNIFMSFEKELEIRRRLTSVPPSHTRTQIQPERLTSSPGNFRPIWCHPSEVRFLWHTVAVSYDF